MKYHSIFKEFTIMNGWIVIGACIGFIVVAALVLFGITQL